MQVRTRNRRALRTLIVLTGFAVGLGVGYWIWGLRLFQWGVPGGIPILVGTSIGALLAHALVPHEENHGSFSDRWTRYLEAGGKGLLVGAGIGTLVAAVPASLAFAFLPEKWGMPIMTLIFGMSAGGLVGFLHGASTSYKRSG